MLQEAYISQRKALVSIFRHSLRHLFRSQFNLTGDGFCGFLTWVISSAFDAPIHIVSGFPQIFIRVKEAT
ncbi:MAG: hypothetical protein AAFQ83_19210 [Bacteroidota bacterium]